MNAPALIRIIATQIAPSGSNPVRVRQPVAPFHANTVVTADGQTGAAPATSPAGRVACILSAVILILAPQLGWPITPEVRGHLELKIDVRRSVDRVTDQLRAASEEAGLQCTVIPFESFSHLAYHGGVRCEPPKSQDGKFQGAILVNSIERTKTVTVGVESIDAVPHHITVHPNVERALQAFKNTIAEDDNVERFQECLWPDLEPCKAPLPD